MSSTNKSTVLSDIEKYCKALRIKSFYSELCTLLEDPETLKMGHLDVIREALLSEITQRDEIGLKRRLKSAGLKHQAACVENVDYEAKRGLSPAMIKTLSTCDWIRNAQNCIITGMTGVQLYPIFCRLAKNPIEPAAKSRRATPHSCCNRSLPEGNRNVTFRRHTAPPDPHESSV